MRAVIQSDKLHAVLQANRQGSFFGYWCGFPYRVP